MADEQTEAEKVAAVKATKEEHLRQAELYKKQQGKIAERHAIFLADRERRMNRPKKVENPEDAFGRPDGGQAGCVGVSIHWQKGPRGQNSDIDPQGRQEPNGAGVGDVIELALGRLEYLNTKQPSPYNEKAIASLKIAVGHLADRKTDREARGVHGLDKA